MSTCKFNKINPQEKQDQKSSDVKKGLHHQSINHILVLADLLDPIDLLNFDDFFDLPDLLDLVSKTLIKFARPC